MVLTVVNEGNESAVLENRITLKQRRCSQRKGFMIPKILIRRVKTVCTQRVIVSYLTGRGSFADLLGAIACPHGGSFLTAWGLS